MNTTFKEKCVHVADLIHQQLIAVFFLLILWEVFKNYELNSVGTWHIVLCVFGFGVCMVEALLMFNNDGVLKGVDRPTRGKYHAILMILACLSISVGVSLKIYQKADAGREHFTSVHGRLGLSAWIVTVVTIITGPFMTTYSRLFSSSIRPIWLKGAHIILGIAAYVIGIVTLGYGLNYLATFTGENGRIALLVFLICYVVYSLVRPVLSCFNLFFR